MSEPVLFSVYAVWILILNVIAIALVRYVQKEIHLTLRRRPWMILAFRALGVSALFFLYFPIIEYASRQSISLRQSVLAGVVSATVLIALSTVWLVVMIRPTERFLRAGYGKPYRKHHDFIVALAWVVAGLLVLLITWVVLLSLMR